MMWISRKKWKEMEKKVEVLALAHENNRDCINNELSDNCHFGCYHYGHRAWDEEMLQVLDAVLDHKTKVQTNSIPDLTLTELARYVIDNEPIVREEEVKIKKVFR